MQDLNDKITGGTLTASEFNQPMSEIQNIIEDSGQLLSGANLRQLSFASGLVVATKTIANSANMINGRQVFITSEYDGGSFTMRTGAPAGTYNDNAGAYTGTKFTSGDGSSGLERNYSGDTDVKWFGAKGLGVDYSDELQAAADSLSTGGTLLFQNGDFRVIKHSGANDSWGIKITNSNITVKGDNATLRRLDPDISTYAKAFPPLFLGIPDSNGSAIEKIKVVGLEIVGEDTQGNQGENDGRHSIVVKNVDGLLVRDCEFPDMDSGSIWTQKPADYDYVNSVYYNTTKSYNIKIIENTFKSVPHATVARDKQRAVVATGADNVNVSNNIFEWCDVCVSSNGTYNNYSDSETDTYTDTHDASSIALGAIKRCCRGLVVKGNNVLNSSEHAFYLSSMGVTCDANTIVVDNPTVCNISQMQIRSRGIAITGNILTGVYTGIHINVGSMDVVCEGNPIQAVGDYPAGIIGVTSNALTSYLDARSDFYTDYKPMQNISIKGNTINMDSAAQTDGYALRIYTDPSDVNFPNGQMLNVSINANIVNNCKHFVYFISPMIKRFTINNNIVSGKLFTEAAFSTGTVMNSKSVFTTYFTNNAETLREVSANNNKFYGFEYMFDNIGGTPTAGTYHTCVGMDNNKMDYFKYFSIAAYRSLKSYTKFSNNMGDYFLDRTTWFGTASLNNSMNLTTGNNNSSKKSMIEYIGVGDVRLYTDDAGTYESL